MRRISKRFPVRIGPRILRCLRRWGSPGRTWPGSLLAGLRERALAERHRWPLWLPVALGVGTALYFAAPVEPSLLTGWVMAALFAAMAAGAFVSQKLWIRAGLAFVAALALGFATAKLYEAWVAAPVLQRPVVTHLTGRVVGLDWGSRGLRVVVDQVRSGRLPDPPARLRVLVRKGAEAVRIGQGIGATAQLMPPPGPAAPGDNDFGRAAFFAEIGATGFAYGAPEQAPLAHSPGLWDRLTAFVEDMRAGMTLRIRANLPSSQGAIASAIITGERGGIDPEDEVALRDAGLAHVLAIAGLHMALVGAGLFWLVRAMLAAIPVLALTYPIKKWAACAALAGAGFYIVISGASSSATRAFVMLSMMLLAILLDRPALSMRSLGLAATILLLIRPVAITEPGFQMSFAAVASLIAVAEWEQRRERSVPRGWFYRHVRAIALTSSGGELCDFAVRDLLFPDAPRITPFWAIFWPCRVMGLVVMPSAALSVAAMPFGGEHAPLQLLGWSIGVMLRLGRFVSDLPGAVTVTPAFPLSALIAMALGGLWLLLWRQNWRWWGLLPMLVGVMMALLAPRPDLIVASDARTIAVRGVDGLLYFPRPPKDHYAAARWLLRDGVRRDWRDAVGGGTSVHCDALGCVTRWRDWTIAAGLRPEALMEDCLQADIVVNVAPAMACGKPRLVLGGRKIAAAGGYVR